MGDPNNPPLLNAATMTVKGGRLKRDHTLGNVPNHYVRDRLMDYINTQLEEEKRESARKAVFSDLSNSEVLEYAALIQKQREKEESKQEIVGDIIGDRHVHTEREAKHIWEQVDVMEDIDENIDLTPKPGFSHMTYDMQLEGSAIKPGCKDKLPEEIGVDLGTEIDQDCDQIRAMIKILTCSGDEWTADQFRRALGNLSREKLTSFLKQRGPTKGTSTKSYQLGWQFFKLRERLGFPLTPASSSESLRYALRDRDPNRGQKRLSVGEEKEPAKQLRTEHGAVVTA
ncbi:hypothetical protein M426DRAFT_151212 [Hypoxylon sp. CI-4A]|nr:hypothetical protein M426DRAFT_151212 [Hypoxylon sp. CI-4A]